MIYIFLGEIEDPKNYDRPSFSESAPYRNYKSLRIEVLIVSRNKCFRFLRYLSFEVSRFQDFRNQGFAVYRNKGFRFSMFVSFEVSRNQGFEISRNLVTEFCGYES
jgi:hypothetical protein